MFLFSTKEDISKESVSQAGVFVLACPRMKFTEAQFGVLRRYVEEGGALLVMMEEGGEKKANTNINFLLEEYGIAINNGIIKFYLFF